MGDNRKVDKGVCCICVHMKKLTHNGDLLCSEVVTHIISPSPTRRLSELNSALLSLKLEVARDREALQDQQSKVGSTLTQSSLAAPWSWGKPE